MLGHDERGAPTLGTPDLAAYRSAVADLMLDIAGSAGHDVARAESILTERASEPEIATLLAATPSGAQDAVARVAAELQRFRSNPRSCATDLGALARVALLCEIENVWWGHLPPYRTDAQVRAAPELADVAALRRGGWLRFCYRRQPGNLLTRATRAGERRMWPDRTPRTAGLRTARARPEVVSLLQQLAPQLAARTDGDAPPLWVTSLTRSQRQQQRLRALGYTALLPSSHCVGYAMNVEMAWLRRFDVHGTLAALLLERQRAGELNVVDEGQAWHVCVSPSAAQELRREFTRLVPGQPGGTSLGA